MSSKQKLMNIIVFLVSIALAQFFASLGYREISAFEHVSTWKETQATISAHSIHQIPLRSGAKYIRRDRWTPVWFYEFKINSEFFRSNSISYSDAKILTYKDSKEKAENILNTHPIGAIVTIYYNPDNPSETIIEKWPLDKEKRTTYYFFAIMSFILINSVLVLNKRTKHSKD